MEAKIERVYRIIDLQNRAFENLESNTESIITAIEKLISEISLEAWWRNVITRSHEDFEKLCQYASGKSSMPGNINENVILCQGAYNKFKTLTPQIADLLSKDEKKILESIPTQASIAKFLNGRSVVRYTQIDLEHHVYLILWAKLRLFSRYKEIANVDDKMGMPGILDKAFSFFTRNMDSSQTELYDTILRYDSFLHSPEGFLLLYEPTKPIVYRVYFLLLVSKLIEEEPFLRKETFDSVKDAAIHLGVDDNELLDDYNKSREIIASAIKKVFNGVSLDDDRIERLYSDLTSITDDSLNPNTSYYFIEKIPYFYGMRKKLFGIRLEGVLSELRSLFVYMNANLLGIDNREIVSLFSGKSFCSVIQKEYDSFRRSCPIPTYAFEFVPSFKKVLSEYDFKWGGKRSSQCFNLPWNRMKIQLLYDKLVTLKLIDPKTDVRDFCKALTGLTDEYNSKNLPIVNWIGEEKQSLALFIGELKKRNITKLKWSSIPSVFLYKGEEISFHSSTPYNQALKTGKFETILHAIKAAEVYEAKLDEML